MGAEELKEMMPDEEGVQTLDPDSQTVEMTFTRNTITGLLPDEESEREEMTYTVADVTPTSLRMTTTDPDGKVEVLKVEFLPDGRMKILLPEDDADIEAFLLPFDLPEYFILRRK